MTLTRRALCAILYIAAFTLIPGCGSDQSTVSLDDGINNYQAQRYALAQTQAQDVMKNAKGTERDQAAYLAGLSSYQLGRPDQARTNLTIAARSKDDQTAGRAAAQLGIIELDRDRPLDAATQFKTASAKLEGTESRQAAQHAAMAYQLAGDYNSAKQWTELGGKGDAKTVAWPKSSSSQSSRYVLQAGAFKSRKLAEKAAKDLEPVANQHRLGPVRIVDDGSGKSSELHLVQFGGFTTRTEAVQVRAKIGKLELIVVPAERTAAYN